MEKRFDSKEACIEGLPGIVCVGLLMRIEGCISRYIRLLCWRDASHNTLDYCIGGMHLTIH